MNSNTKVVLGVLGAVAAGAVIGLLLAPEKGSEMRKKISKTATDWTGQLSDIFTKSKAEMEDVASKASKAAKRLHEKANNIYDKKENYI